MLIWFLLLLLAHLPRRQHPPPPPPPPPCGLSRGGIRIDQDQILMRLSDQTAGTIFSQLNTNSLYPDGTLVEKSPTPTKAGSGRLEAQRLGTARRSEPPGPINANSPAPSLFCRVRKERGREGAELPLRPPPPCASCSGGEARIGVLRSPYGGEGGGAGGNSSDWGGGDLQRRRPPPPWRRRG